MKLEFENQFGERRVIGNPENVKEMWNIISDFLRDHNYKSYYSRVNMGIDEWWIDVGSHCEGFAVTGFSDKDKMELTQ